MKTKTPLSSLGSHLLAALIGGSMLITYQVVADNTTPSQQPRTLGYQGTLEWDGQPHDGPTLMKFSLYPDDADGTASCWEGEGLVDVRNGQFAVELGGNIGAPITDSDFDGGLFVGIEVQRLGTPCAEDAECGGEVGSCDMTLGYCAGPEEDFIALGNRQKITAVPYAMASTRANDFVVNGDLQVDGVVNGGLQVDGLLRVSNNSAGSANDSGMFADYNDYQIVLWDTGTSPTSYGLGVASNTLWFNTDADFRWYRDGDLRMLLDDDTRLSVLQPELHLGGTASNGKWKLFSYDGLTIFGENGELYLRIEDDGNIELRPNGQLALSASPDGTVGVEGNLAVDGNLMLGGTGTSRNWAIDTSDTLTIYEPEDRDKVHLRIEDNGNIDLLPNGQLALSASPDGTVGVVGNLAVGLQYKHDGTTCAGTGGIDCECPAGKKAIGGGVDCDGTDVKVQENYPLADLSGWHGHCSDNTTQVYVICARMQ